MNFSSSIFRLLCLFTALTVSSFAQNTDISSGGFPTITGSGSVTGSANSGTTQNINVSINFWDVSPISSSNTIKVVVPVAIRSTVPYQVIASSDGSFNPDLRAFQASDIGFGAANFRSMGIGALQCTQSTHDFRAPFNNNLENNISFDTKGRSKYTSSLSDVNLSSVILSGPRLSAGSSEIVTRDPDNGYLFDLIFIVKPQFYAPGNFSLNLSVSIAEGPAAAC